MTLAQGRTNFNGQAPNSPVPADGADCPAARAQAGEQVCNELDIAFQSLLNGLQANWQPTEVVAFTDGMLDFLATYSYGADGPSEGQLRELLGCLQKRLRKLKYQAKAVRAYIADLRDKAKLAGRQGFGGPTPGQAGGGNAGPCPLYYVVPAPGEDPPADPELEGMYKLVGRQPQLTNFAARILADVSVHDDFEPTRRFEGETVLRGVVRSFRINAKDYANGRELEAVLCEAAGAKARFLCKPTDLRSAISALSTPEPKAVTTSIGWNAAGDAFLVPSGRITAAGLTPYENGDIRVDLSGEDRAACLDLKCLDPVALAAVKAHVAEDFLQLHDRRVMYALAGTVAAALLARFAEGVRRFALWLEGPSGAGKSFAAQLAQNFFGKFSMTGEDQMATWTSTVNFLQRHGFFFKDAIYLVDDYKPEYVTPFQAIRLIQNYADGTARGRLRVDATANMTRPIRGFLVVTGEDILEQSSSVMARCIRVPVPYRRCELRAADLERGRRCLQHYHNYPGVTADFIRHLLSHGRIQRFGDEVRCRQDFFNALIQGQPNGLRIAGNFALLAAAFAEMAAYMQDVWPAWQQATREFIEQDLAELCVSMVGDVREQQASQIFVATLADLIEQRRVQVNGYQPHDSLRDFAPVIGSFHFAQRPRDRAVGAPPLGFFQLSTKLSLEAVNESLRRQVRSPLRISEKALLQQLRRDGLLVGEDGLPVPPDGNCSGTVSVGGGRIRRAFRILPAALFGSEHGNDGGHQ
jgi:hypothetical protein